MSEDQGQGALFDPPPAPKGEPPTKKVRREREPDLSWEALVENTRASMPTERGKVNRALADIRSSLPELSDAQLALEISHRSLLYRRLYPEMPLTPVALAANWDRVAAEATRAPANASNQAASATTCDTCHGDRFVEVQTRPPVTTQWMTEHGLEADPTTSIAEVAPCPDCNAVEIEFFRHDGSKFRSLDPAETKLRMRA